MNRHLTRLPASLALLAAAALAVGAPAQAAGETQILQQRTADGRILLTDRPAAGAKTERSWQLNAEDQAAARQRAADVKTEARVVSERVQRSIDRQEQMAEASADRQRMARADMPRDSYDDEITGGGVLLYPPYGYGQIGGGYFGGGSYGNGKGRPNYGGGGYGHGYGDGRAGYGGGIGRNTRAFPRGPNFTGGPLASPRAPAGPGSR